MRVNTEKGITLVEILAALVILGIVFVSFMAIFPQMNLFNNRTETKLVTMNIAKQELTKIKESPSLLNASNKIKGSNNPDFFETYDLSRDGYTIHLDCYDVNSQSCSGGDKSIRKPTLYKIHIKVKENSTLNSETFGYLEFE